MKEFEREEIETVLKEFLSDFVSEVYISEISRELALKFQKRIQVKILEEAKHKTWVRFRCNLSLEEMESRHREVSLLLPFTQSSEDYMYNVELKPCRWKEVDFPHPSRSKDGWWSYLARA